MVLGTPLPPLEKDKERFIPEWKQEARNEQGRKRFHGAFTGGFTAGYHNTVGSKEGFFPADYSSSRRARASDDVHRLEDYMDEEDWKEMQRGNTLVAVTEGTTQLSAKKGLGWDILRRLGWNGLREEPSSIYKLLQTYQQAKEDRAKTTQSGFGGEDDDESMVYSAASRESFSKTIVPVEQRQRERRPRAMNSASGNDDGCLEGFVRSMAKCVLDVFYPPPDMPKDYMPKPPAFAKDKDEATKGELDKPMTVVERGRALGESTELAPSTTKDMAMQKDDDHFSIDVMTAMNAQRGYMPFLANPTKDARYRQFLAHFAAKDQNNPLPKQLPGTSNSEYLRELVEFSKAARIYRPLPLSMASKFVSSTRTFELAPAKVGLYRMASSSESRKAEDEKREAETQKVLAMLHESAPPTRTIERWRPPASLIKVFDLEPEEQADGEEEDTKTVKPVLTMDSLQKIVSQSEYADRVDPSIFKTSETIEEDQGDDADELIDQFLSMCRPSIQVFKSIFAPDDAQSTKDQMEGREEERKTVRVKKPLRNITCFSDELEDAPLVRKKMSKPVDLQDTKEKAERSADLQDTEPKGEEPPQGARQGRPAASDYW